MTKKATAHIGVCGRCGCTDLKACVILGEPCFWIKPNVCSACATVLELAAAMGQPHKNKGTRRHHRSNNKHQ